MPRASPYVINLSVAERAALETRRRRYSLPYREVVRAKEGLATVLARAVEDGDDTTLREIASVLSDLAIEVELINSFEEHLGPLRADSVTR
jgi:hypothetical protein